MDRLCFVLLVLWMATFGCAGQPTAQRPAASIPATEIALEDERADVSDCDLCRRGQAGENLWCDECAAGFIGGERVACKPCFAGKSGGTAWCDACGIGYVEGEPAACKGCVQKAKGEKTDCGGHG